MPVQAYKYLDVKLSWFRLTPAYLDVKVLRWVPLADAYGGPP